MTARLAGVADAVVSYLDSEYWQAVEAADREAL